MVCPFKNLILNNPVFRKYSWTGFLVFPNQTKEAINRSPGIPSDFATQRYGMSQNNICVRVIFKTFFYSINKMIREPSQITFAFFSI